MHSMLARSFAALALLGVSAGPVSAQPDYPNRPVRIIMGSTPGGSGDTGARILAAKLSERLGQPFIVENKPGAAGAVAAAEVARAAPDGYTLLFTASWHSTAAAIKKSLPYDTLKDFTFISTLTTYGMLLGVRPDSPFKTLEELIAYAKANPGKLSYYSVGIGSGHHLIGEWLISLTGAEMLHVPYRGSSAALPDFLAGRVDMMIETMTIALSQAKGGNVRPLAISSIEPMEDLKGVPQTSHIVPGLEYDSWLGLLGPSGMPPALLAKLNHEVQEAVKSPDVQARLRELGAVPRAMTSEEFRSRVEREIAQFKKVVEARKIPMQ